MTGNGSLHVIGCGPGAADLITPRALERLGSADVVVGYRRYLESIGEIIAGKKILPYGMGSEVERAGAAVAEAAGGARTALVSSGDPGVYGMAGLALEMAGPRPGFDIEVVPGVTAALSAAAMLGAPLVNDFAVLSLSDLLTPWSTIERRLEALAACDLVVAVYNPRSRGRREQLAKARRIFLRVRPAETPVGICRRDGHEDIVGISTLGDFDEASVDMTTTVIIGNSDSFVSGGRLITSRGYRR